MNPSDIERTKLFANALDRLSTALVSIGIIAPAVASLYGGPLPNSPAWVLALSALYWVVLAAFMHIAARAVLKELDK